MRRKLGTLRQIVLTDLMRAPIISYIIAQLLRLLRPRYLRAFIPKPNRILHEDYSKSHVSRVIFRPQTRSAIPISLASALSWPQTNSHSILLVGPRYESDYFLLRGYGFSADRIKLLDQFSTAPRIEVGDAHEMKFADEQFDFLILSWCLAYSADPAGMVSEAWRTLKKEGVLIACSESRREESGEGTEETSLTNLTSDNTFRLFPSGSMLLAQFDSPVGRDGLRAVSCVAARKVE